MGLSRGEKIRLIAALIMDHVEALSNPCKKLYHGYTDTDYLPADSVRVTGMDTLSHIIALGKSLINQAVIAREESIDGQA